MAGRTSPTLIDAMQPYVPHLRSAALALAIRFKILQSGMRNSSIETEQRPGVSPIRKGRIAPLTQPLAALPR